MVLDLPSITDITDVIIFLIPGFVTFFLARKIGIIDHKFSDMETVVMIIILSLINYILFAYITGIENLDQIGEKIFVPQNTLLLVLIIVGMGLLIGFLFKRVFKRSSVSGSSWDQIFRSIQKSGSWALIYTETKEFKGILVNMSEGDSREVILNQPKQVFRDQNHNVTYEIPLGNKVIFPNGEIKSLVLI